LFSPDVVLPSSSRTAVYLSLARSLLPRIPSSASRPSPRPPAHLRIHFTSFPFLLTVPTLVRLLPLPVALRFLVWIGSDFSISLSLSLSVFFFMNSLDGASNELPVNSSNRFSLRFTLLYYALLDCVFQCTVYVLCSVVFIVVFRICLVLSECQWSLVNVVCFGVGRTLIGCTCTVRMDWSYLLSVVRVVGQIVSSASCC
jgi:hypothetical protein